MHPPESGQLQGRDGVFAAEIVNGYGSYRRWAASWPYLRDPWIATKGENRFTSARLRFLRNWYDDPTLPPASMVSFELYPWHSTSLTATLRPDPTVVGHWLWEPVAELAAPVFAFGAPWFAILERLGLETVARLGNRGDDYGSEVASRAVGIYRDPATGIVLSPNATKKALARPTRPRPDACVRPSSG